MSTTKQDDSITLIAQYLSGEGTGKVHEECMRANAIKLNNIITSYRPGNAPFRLREDELCYDTITNKLIGKQVHITFLTVRNGKHGFATFTGIINNIKKLSTKAITLIEFDGGVIFSAHPQQYLKLEESNDYTRRIAS